MDALFPLLGVAMGDEGEINTNLAAGVISPLFDTELIPNGNMEAGDPPTGWLAGASAALSAAADERTGGAGVASLNVARNGVNEPYAYRDFTAVVGNWLYCSLWRRLIDATNVSSFLATQASRAFNLTEANTTTGTNWSQVEMTYRATVAGMTIVPAYVSTALDGRSARCDDVSVKPILFSSMRILLGNIGHRYGTYTCTPTITNQTQCGMLIEYLDDNNFVMAIVDRGKTEQAQLIQCVAGVYTVLISGNITYGAAQSLQVIVSNDYTHTLYYNGTRVGSVAHVYATTGTQVCAFSTHVSNAVGAVTTSRLTTQTALDALPVFDVDMVRYAGNPIITNANTGLGGTTAADPYLIEIGGTLYLFFEATTAVGVGQIWMAQSTDGYTWTNFQKVSDGDTVHSAHPMVLIDSGTVHLYYQYNAAPNNYYIRHRSSPVATFPDWSASVTVFDPVAFGWSTVNEFDIFQHSDTKWYLLAVTDSDLKVRGMWSNTLSSDWNTDGTAISASPIIDVGTYSWLGSANGRIVEITRLNSGGRTLLYFGAKRNVDLKRAISVFEVTTLNTTTFAGVWLANDHTFGIAASGFDNADLHRACAAFFNSTWFLAYDALRDGEWKIGIATK